MSFFALCIVVCAVLLVRGYTCGQLARRELVDVVEASRQDRATERDALHAAFAGLSGLASPDDASPDEDTSRAAAHSPSA